MRPNLYDISWKVTEPEYREDPALSYSTLARYAREGFNKLDNLFDRIETPSLSFGSAVDALITGGQEEFDANFIVAEFPPLKDSVVKMVRELFNRYSEQYRTIEDIPTDSIIAVSEELAFQLNWKPETRAKVVKEQGSEYYTIMHAALGKKILDTETKNQVDASVRALRESESTKFYFAPNDPFDDSIQRFYQLKFKATFLGIDYRCMSDLIVVDHKNKTIQPIDLKTSSHTEWDFYESFIQWNYQIQARLYWRIIKYNLSLHDEFKEYTLLPYKFIVVNKQTLTPLVWDYEDTEATGTLYYGKNKQIECRDPFDLGKELSNYLSSRPAVPCGIKINEGNSLTEWLKTL